MTTIHANTSRDALARLEVMIAMAGYDIPMRALRAQIANAITVIVQSRRLTGGRRKVINVSEITGMEGEQIQMHDLFSYEQTGVDTNGHATGRFLVTGIRPRCADRIENRGIRLPSDLFLRIVIADVGRRAEETHPWTHCSHCCSPQQSGDAALGILPARASFLGNERRSSRASGTENRFDRPRSASRDQIRSIRRPSAAAVPSALLNELRRNLVQHAGMTVGVSVRSPACRGAGWVL